uniref:Uncharacterized protein n=1 Tax=Glossina palpalis gambiensis TaxID=67801 RepID=A0A1B0BYQ1_9MUSC
MGRRMCICEGHRNISGLRVILLAGIPRRRNLRLSWFTKATRGVVCERLFVYGPKTAILENKAQKYVKNRSVNLKQAICGFVYEFVSNEDHAHRSDSKRQRILIFLAKEGRFWRLGLEHIGVSFIRSVSLPHTVVTFNGVDNGGIKPLNPYLHIIMNTKFEKLSKRKEMVGKRLITNDFVSYLQLYFILMTDVLIDAFVLNV